MRALSTLRVLALVGVAACHSESRRGPGSTVTPAQTVVSVPFVAPIMSADAAASSAQGPTATVTPAQVERVAVRDDSLASVVRAPTGKQSRIVFMPGLCSNAYAYLLSFPETARAHGGIVAIEGDKPCGAANSGFRTFSWNPTLQRSRIDAALAAAGVTAPGDGFTLVGYSSGASIAQMVHERWPDLFPRLVIIAPPEDPKVDRLLKARGVVSMSCSYDVPGRMKDATRRLNARGVPSIYIEMPKCTHGVIADGERVFGEAFDWLDGRTPDAGL